MLQALDLVRGLCHTIRVVKRTSHMNITDINSLSDIQEFNKEQQTPLQNICEQLKDIGPKEAYDIMMAILECQKQWHEDMTDQCYQEHDIEGFAAFQSDFEKFTIAHNILKEVAY